MYPNYVEIITPFRKQIFLTASQKQYRFNGKSTFGRNVFRRKM